MGSVSLGFSCKWQGCTMLRMPSSSSSSMPACSSLPGLQLARLCGSSSVCDDGGARHHKEGIHRGRAVQRVQRACWPAVSPARRTLHAPEQAAGWPLAGMLCAAGTALSVVAASLIGGAAGREVWRPRGLAQMDCCCSDSESEWSAIYGGVAT